MGDRLHGKTMLHFIFLLQKNEKKMRSFSIFLIPQGFSETNGPNRRNFSFSLGKKTFFDNTF